MPPSPLFDPGTDETRRALLDVLEIPIHIVDAQLRVVCANRTIKAWNRTLHLTAEMEGKLLREIYPFLKDKVYEEYGRVMETGRQLTTEEMTEVGGAARYTETTKIPVLEGKRVVHVNSTKEGGGVAEILGLDREKNDLCA